MDRRKLFQEANGRLIQGLFLTQVQSNQNVKSKGQIVQSKLEKYAVQKWAHSSSGGLKWV